MINQLLLSAAEGSSSDSGVRTISAVSARMSYVAMCVTLCWGVLSATGWLHRLTGHRASPRGHALVSMFALVTGVTHGLAFLFIDERGLNLGELVIPFFGGGYARHALGIVGLELMIAVGVTAGLKRRFAGMDWVPFHRFAYLAVWLTTMHAWLGAAANGSVSTLWLGGITVIAPAITLTVLRFLPPETLVRVGLVDNEPVGKVTEGPRHVESVSKPISKPARPAPSTRPEPTRRAGRAASVERRRKLLDPPTVRIAKSQVTQGQAAQGQATQGQVAEGQVKEQVDQVRVSVDHVLCHHYGLCQAQAPKVFRLMEDGRLRYARNPEPEQAAHVRAAAHACPMRAIQVEDK